MNNGDLNAASEMLELSNKIVELGSKIDKSKSDLTSAQLSRYMKISEKYLKNLQK